LTFSSLFSFSTHAQLQTVPVTNTVPAIICPTHTVTAYAPTCTSFIKCAGPACILTTATISNPCGCPSAIPTSTSIWPYCHLCFFDCQPTYKTIPTACPTTKAIAKTTSAVSCPTVTAYAPQPGVVCPDVCQVVPRNAIEERNCALIEIIDVPCGCPGLATVTRCPNCRPGGCQPGYEANMLPCPT
jgi:hypothetical protein